MNLESEYQKALAEIGPITPWWSEPDHMYLFEHPFYPWVMHADPSCDETIAGYHRALKGFIEDRINGGVAPETDRSTLGRGGARPGAGRPRKLIKSRRTYIPEDIAQWLENPAHQEQVRRMIRKA